MPSMSGACQADVILYAETKTHTQTLFPKDGGRGTGRLPEH